MPERYITPGRWTVTTGPVGLEGYTWRLVDATGAANGAADLSGTANDRDRAERDARYHAAQREARERHQAQPKITKVLA